MKRYGIFGGSFNPPHIGHSILADDVREQMHLDKIIFIPTGKPVLKDPNLVISAKHRYNMTKLAFAEDKNFEVSDMEVTRPDERSYTVDTLIKLKEKYSKDFVKLYLILGVDNLVDLHKWKTPEKLFLLSEVVVMNRPNYNVRDVDTSFSSKVKYLSLPMLEISSTMIRDYIANNKSIKYLVHPAVEKYIADNGLYKNM